MKHEMHPTNQALPSYAIGQKKHAEENNMTRNERDRLVEMETKLEVYEEIQKKTVDVLDELKEQFLLFGADQKQIKETVESLKSETVGALIKKNIKYIILAAVVLFGGGAVTPEILKTLSGLF